MFTVQHWYPTLFPRYISLQGNSTYFSTHSKNPKRHRLLHEWLAGLSDMLILTSHTASTSRADPIQAMFFFGGGGGFAFPSYISGVHHFWVRFLRMCPFFNPTIKVVTFRLRGWCMLGVFLLPAFTRLGHERQDLLSPCDEMRVCTD